MRESTEHLQDEKERLRESTEHLQDENERLQDQEEQLRDEIASLRQMVEDLSDEIKVLKNLPKRPKIKPSGMAQTSQKSSRKGDQKATARRGPKRYSKNVLERELVLKAQNVPPGSKRNGYKDYIVQNLRLQVEKIRYRREVWITPSGERITAELPPSVSDHFGADVRRFVVALYYLGQSTKPRITQLLNDLGVSISDRKVGRMLTDDVRGLVDESYQVLTAGMAAANWLNVDDTGARHANQNGYCTVIGNDHFTYFATRNSKSRLNFLELLCGKDPAYTLNAAAFDYMRGRNLPEKTIALLRAHPRQIFDHVEQWKQHLDILGISARKVHPEPVRIATEGALWGTLTATGSMTNTVILSDNAGQFKLGQHALCWVHAERHLHQLAATSDNRRRLVENKKTEIWRLYRRLCQYRKKPTPARKKALSRRFDIIFQEQTDYYALNQLLQRLYRNKSELLTVLDHPNTPLHTNLAENDIRAQVIRRKISAGTRSDAGREARDAALGIMKTCHKLKLSFWDYLGDRFNLPDTTPIAPLPELVRQKSIAPAPT